jgi:hypothetical protein
MAAPPFVRKMTSKGLFEQLASWRLFPRANDAIHQKIDVLENYVVVIFVMQVLSCI